jgi:Flp pilus assembly pilin Flp
MQDITIRTTVAVQNFLARLRDDEEGQAAVEYAGILAVIALIFVALFALGLDSTISNAVRDAVNSILGNGGGGGGGGGGNG